MANKKKNWNIVKKQKKSETLRFRDVYEDQQLERSSIAPKQTMFSRAIIAAVLALITFFVVWLIATGIQMAKYQPHIEESLDPRGTWVHCDAYYINKNDETDRITPEEYERLQAEYDPNYPEVADPGPEPTFSKTWFEESNHVGWAPLDGASVWLPEGYENYIAAPGYEKYTDDKGNMTGRDDNNEKIPQSVGEEYAAACKERLVEFIDNYEVKAAAYQDYLRHSTDPSTVYERQREHYRNYNDITQYILPDEYEKRVAQFDKQLASGKLGEQGEVPYQPFNPNSLYKADTFGVRDLAPWDLWEPINKDGEVVLNPDGTTATEYNETEETPVYDEGLTGDDEEEISLGDESDVTTEESSESETEPTESTPSGDTKIVEYRRISDPTVTISIEEYDALVADREAEREKLTYRHVLDGHVITWQEFEELRNKYSQDIETYKEVYMAHREQYHGGTEMDPRTFNMAPNVSKVLISFAVAGIVFGLLYMVLERNLAAQNALSDTSDINQYHNDQHVALPEEIMQNYDYAPDVGAHTSVSVSGILGHVAIQKKGLKNVEVAERYDKDVKDEHGTILYYKNEIKEDENGNPITKSLPIIDMDFMDALYEASLEDIGKGDEDVRMYYDMTKVPYNPGNKNRDKLINKEKPYETVADLINADWEFPLYEPTRPAGAYIVDTAPVNTMVLAITRAGKGQTIIEPTIDIWTREKRPNNMVINDPKGELLVKNYVRATVRGLQVVQFNLINAMKTDIYNPLAMAADAAREGDTTKCAMYVENIAEVFFPTDKSNEPMWPTAANNAFKRAAYGLIDYYLEEEKAMRRMAERTGMDTETLEHKIDEMWGKVTLYNCYQLFVQLSSKKMKNPAVEFTNNTKAKKYDDLTDEEFQKLLEETKAKSALWEEKPDADMLTLYFAATDMLPRNTMRTLVANANNALKAMAGAEKMLASVYGIAITAMAFFTDPTISTLTSGTLAQNVDLASLSFPRRMGVRFNTEYMEKYHFVGQQAVWDAFEDENFEKPLGKLFHHEDMVTREGWARYYFDGKFKEDIGYVRLEIRNPRSDSLIRTFYFKFKKDYQKSLDGRVYMKDPILNERVVKNGIMTELRKFKTKDGKIVFRPAKTTFKQKKILDIKAGGDLVDVNSNAIISTMCRYAEKPKMIFLVTPPHLMKYAKLILILIKQLVDLNFDKSYMTKSNQKPLYKTRFMLDELGNLQSEGHGISGFETMLSIGLGQEQQFTLILQTLQQLRDVYGESVDKIVQGNTSNIVFLKSTDDSMIETLSKMSGIRHKTYTDSKTVTKDQQAILKMKQNEGKISVTMTTKEENVISYNDMAFISPRNSIVFRAGDAPIWNRNQMVLPMSWRLFKDTIVHPGHDYTLQTIPTLSTAMEFDVRKNQPNFYKMLDKRIDQAYLAQEATKQYQKAYGYSDYQMEQLDLDNKSDEIMDIVCSSQQLDSVNQAIMEYAENDGNNKQTDYSEEGLEEMFDYMYGNKTADEVSFEVEQDIFKENFGSSTAVENKDQAVENAKREMEYKEASKKRYAGNLMSRDDFVSKMGYNHSFDEAIVRVYRKLRSRMEKDEEYFVVANGNLYSADGSTLYIKNLTSSDELKAINEALSDDESRVHSFDGSDITEDDIKAIGSFVVQDAFLDYLVSFPGAWPFVDGEFDLRMKAEFLDEVEDDPSRQSR